MSGLWGSGSHLPIRGGVSCHGSSLSGSSKFEEVLTRIKTQDPGGGEETLCTPRTTRISSTRRAVDPKNPILWIRRNRSHRRLAQHELPSRGSALRASRVAGRMEVHIQRMRQGNRWGTNDGLTVTFLWNRMSRMAVEPGEAILVGWRCFNGIRERSISPVHKIGRGRGEDGIIDRCDTMQRLMSGILL